MRTLLRGASYTHDFPTSREAGRKPSIRCFSARPDRRLFQNTIGTNVAIKKNQIPS